MRLLVMSIIVMFITLPACGADQISVGDAQSDFNAGQYRSCLQKISSSLTGSTAKPGSSQRYDALMLRGECMLQLKRGDLAADAFESAARAVKAEGDLKRVAAAKAVAVLIRESTQLKYKSAQKSEPVDIVQPSSRSEAMKALLEDRLAALTPEVDKATQGTSLVPMEKLVPALRDLYSVELTVSGETTRTMALFKVLGERARNLIHAELDRCEARIDELYELAGEPTIGAGGNVVRGYRGLTSPERDELHGIADTLVKIERVAQVARRLSRTLGGATEAWETILADCVEVRDRAQQAYDRRY